MKICAIDAGYKSYEYEIKLFGKDNFVVNSFDSNLENKITLAKSASGLLVRGTVINGSFLDLCPNLKAIVRYGVGYDNIDLQSCTDRGIKVANVQGYANHSVSDHAIALMYACVRSLRLGEKDLQINFSVPPRNDIFELFNKTIGIIGLGRIGGMLCSKVKNLFQHVLACDPYISKDKFLELGAESTSLQQLLAESDIISLNCNLTEETTGLLNEQSISLIKQKPIVINTARGPIINESALINALEKGQIHSAGLDVYEDEPPTTKQNALLNHPHVIATGHYAWYSDRASMELQKRAADNLFELLNGKIPEDCLNP
jgi:D-3-phosphoglycerate dehydrogenase / 2-oxoglutarate reductase